MTPPAQPHGMPMEVETNPPAAVFPSPSNTDHLEVQVPTPEAPQSPLIPVFMPAVALPQCSTLVDNVLSRQYVQVVLQCATRGFGPCRLTM